MPSARVTLDVRANTCPSCTRRGTARGCFSLVTLSASVTPCMQLTVSVSRQQNYGRKRI